MPDEMLVCGCGAPDTAHENNGRGLGPTGCAETGCGSFAADLRASALPGSPAGTLPEDTATEEAP